MEIIITTGIITTTGKIILEITITTEIIIFAKISKQYGII
jgi:hypothetical protein